MVLPVPFAGVHWRIRLQFPRSGSVACIPLDPLRIPRPAADHQAGAPGKSLEHARLVCFLPD